MGIKRLSEHQLKDLGYKFFTEAELFAKYEPNPSELIRNHDAYNERSGLNISMPGLRTKAERMAIYRDWEMQDASAKFAKTGKV